MSDKIAELESVLKNAADLVAEIHDANDLLKTPSPYTAGIKAKIFGAVEMLAQHKKHVAANPKLAAPAKPAVAPAAAALIALLLLLSACFIPARAAVPFIGSPILVDGTSNFYIVPIVSTIPVSQFWFTLGNVTNPATIFQATVNENIGGTNMLQIGSAFSYPYSSSTTGTNGVTTNLPPVNILVTNYLYVVASTGTNTVPIQGTYGY